MAAKMDSMSPRSELFQRSAEFEDVRALAHPDRQPDRLFPAVAKQVLRRILIGAADVRDVGQAAREELERVLGTRIYLGLRVKAQPRWRDDPRILVAMEPGAADFSEFLDDGAEDAD